MSIHEHTPPWQRAAARIDYRGTSSNTEEPRFWRHDELVGPDLTDARDPNTTQPGTWYDSQGLNPGDPDIDESMWLRHYLGMAVGEAVHEVLEWFRVDGQPWLDPHGRHEDHIAQLARDLATKYADLATAGGSAGDSRPDNTH